jgi:hypothetical protein
MPLADAHVGANNHPIKPGYLEISPYLYERQSIADERIILCLFVIFL